MPKTTKATPKRENNQNDSENNPREREREQLTSILAPLLVEECGRTQSVEAGTKGEHENEDNRVIPSSPATTITYVPHLSSPSRSSLIVFSFLFSDVHVICSQ
jgi:hypothetical protein